MAHDLLIGLMVAGRMEAEAARGNIDQVMDRVAFSGEGRGGLVFRRIMRIEGPAKSRDRAEHSDLQAVGKNTNELALLNSFPGWLEP
jgi:hypothetical protein